MSRYSIFDSSGTKIGEIGSDPAPGGGCGCTAFVVVLALGAILIWPSLLGMVFGADASSADRTLGLLTVLAIVANMLVHGRIIRARGERTFVKTWGALVVSGTLFPGLCIGIFVAGMEGNAGNFFLAFVLSFFLSIGAAAVAAFCVTRE